jgi:hypothetical protein
MLSASSLFKFKGYFFGLDFSSSDVARKSSLPMDRRSKTLRRQKQGHLQPPVRFSTIAAPSLNSSDKNSERLYMRHPPLQPVRLSRRGDEVRRFAFGDVLTVWAFTSAIVKAVKRIDVSFIMIRDQLDLRVRYYE